MLLNNQCVNNNNKKIKGEIKKNTLRQMKTQHTKTWAAKALLRGYLDKEEKSQTTTFTLQGTRRTNQVQS